MDIDIDAATERICDLLFSGLEAKAKEPENQSRADVMLKIARFETARQIKEILREEQIMAC